MNKQNSIMNKLNYHAKSIPTSLTATHFQI